MKVTQFFNTDFVDYANYSTLRQLASAIDGLKNSSRKIITTVLDKNITNELKVSQLNSKMAEYTEYLHGDASSVIVTLAQNFPGTNNIPLLDREGNFGTRFKPEASAPRYIYTNGSKELWQLFNKDDKAILKKQYFEGQEIEPQYFLPALPMLLINGSFGTATGFKQEILPRDPARIKTWLVNTLQDKKTRGSVLTPYFEGFKGTVVQGPKSHKQWLIKGVVKKLSITKVLITEVPVGLSLKKYINILDKLEDDKVITGYKDKSDGSNFEFEVSFLSANLKKLTNDQLLAKLKLIKPVTETYSCINENNTVTVFDDTTAILGYYYRIKIQHLGDRKRHLIDKVQTDIDFDNSKYLFIKNIVEGKLKVNKRKKVDIEKDLVKIDGIIMRELSFDYLLNMSIVTLTEERMKKLADAIKEQEQKLTKIKITTVETMWLEDLK